MPETDAKADDKIKKVVELVKDLWPGVEGPAKDTASDEKSVPPEAERASSLARKKYDQTLRWVLGVFSAVGVLIFGSVPFTDLDGVDADKLVVALILAGVGLGIVIWATTIGLEIQDASLGELAQSFKPSHSCWFLDSAIFPRRKANARLKKVMEDSNDATAHLGPGTKKVEQLIRRIGDVEKLSMTASFGWDGGIATSEDQPAAVPRQLAQGSVAAQVAVTKTVAEQLATTKDGLSELRGQLAKNKDDSTIKQALSDLEARYRNLVAQMPSAAQLADAARSSAIDEVRKVYLDHRTLVLEESLVAQMRGTFRVVRRWLMVGAASVLAGGSLYSYAVANPANDDPQGLVTITLKADSDAAKALQKCSGAKDGEAVTVSGLLTSSDDEDGAQDGPFSFVSVVPGCPRTRFEIAEGQGRYVTQVPADTAGKTPVPATNVGGLHRVTVTVNKRTPQMRDLQKCSGQKVGNRLRFQALLQRSDDADAAHNGPFDLLIVNTKCAGIAVKVPEGGGRYVSD